MLRLRKHLRFTPAVAGIPMSHTVESHPPLIFPIVYRLSKPTWRRPFTLAVSA